MDGAKGRTHASTTSGDIQKGVEINDQSQEQEHLKKTHGVRDCQQSVFGLETPTVGKEIVPGMMNGCLHFIQNDSSPFADHRGEHLRGMQRRRSRMSFGGPNRLGRPRQMPLIDAEIM
jgi:hypothetical protein